MVIDSKRSFEQSYWTEIKENVLNTSLYRASSRGSIRQYTKDGTYINTYKNTTEAAKALDIEREKITNAIYGKYATSGYWFLKEDENISQYLDGSIKNEKPVYCYNSDGSFHKKYSAFKEIKKDFKFNKPDLKRAIKNNLLLLNYYWADIEYSNILLENPEIQNKKPTKVYQYTLEGDFIKEWNSITECQKEFPSALQVCLGNRLHCHKFKFSFDKPKI